MRHRFVFFLKRALFAFCIFAVLAAAIWTRPPKWMSDFDQSFYLTIAYDIDRHGVFSNGVYDAVDSTAGVPPPGMFMAPLYPWLVFAVTKLDSRFAHAVACSVEANHQKRDGTGCEVYARPMNLVHALLLALGVLALARSAELIFRDVTTFWLSGAFATLALLPDSDLFSFLMTESLTFAMFNVTMLALVAGWTSGRRPYFAIAGILLGLLCLTRTSFLILAPVMIALIFVKARFIDGARTPAWRSMFVFALCFGLVIFPWALRNYVSVGKFGMTEEYGAAALVERFAFNRMTPREFALAFPYCLPAAGPTIVSRLFGAHEMDRFEWNRPGSFFEVGRGMRDALIAEHGRLDPVFGDLMRAEMSKNWWRHVLVSIPLAWCGLWIGGWLGYILVPAAAWVGVRAIQRNKPLFLLYAAPALVMLALHAGVANHYTRYNLILIGSYAAGAGWLMARSAWFARARLRWRARGPAS